MKQDGPMSLLRSPPGELISLSGSTGVERCGVWWFVLSSGVIISGQDPCGFTGPYLLLKWPELGR